MEEKVRVTGARHENPAEGNCRVTRESECPPKKRNGAPCSKARGTQVSSVHQNQLRITP